MKVGELREELLRGNPELQVAYRVEELEAEVKTLQAEVRLLEIGYDIALARVAELEADPRMALTADDLRWAAKRASGESLYEHVNDPNGDGEAVYARRANRFRAALAAEKGGET